MSKELEEQQRITYELKDQLRSLEADRIRITEQIRIIEGKLVVQELRDAVRVKTEAIKELRVKKQKLEEKLRSREISITPEKQVEFIPSQEENQHTQFQ
ncbi:MAG: hypothetical protein NWE78_03320 [Candidatus Bathyarchaeota archaeon]|nr:hypothetical protein [Candidatus Bathyarchaeota archaeon]